MNKKVKIQSPKIISELEEFNDIREYILNDESIYDKSINSITIDEVSGVVLKLDSCVFKNVTFIDCDFERADLTDVIFENCNLSNVNFSDSGFYRVEFKKCKLTGTRFDESVLKSVSFKDCLGRYSNFSFSKIKGVAITESDFESAVFEEVKIESLTLENTNFRAAIFNGSLLDKVDFTKCRTEDIEVRPTDIRGAIFTVSQALELTRLLGIVVK